MVKQCEMERRSGEKGSAERGVERRHSCRLSTLVTRCRQECRCSKRFMGREKQRTGAIFQEADAMGRERSANVSRPCRPARVGAVHPRPASTPFWLVSIPDLLNPLSGQFGSEPSSEALESIARKTYLAESSDSRLTIQ